MTYEHQIEAAEALADLIITAAKREKGTINWHSHVKPILSEFYTFKSSQELAEMVMQALVAELAIVGPHLVTTDGYQKFFVLRLAAALMMVELAFDLKKRVEQPMHT